MVGRINNTANGDSQGALTSSTGIKKRASGFLIGKRRPSQVESKKSFSKGKNHKDAQEIYAFDYFFARFFIRMEPNDPLSNSN
jgi:hypothetical protein